MGAQADLDRERWTGSKKVFGRRSGTRRMLGRKALRLLGVAAERFMGHPPGEGVESAGRAGLALSRSKMIMGPPH